jgi:type IV pilus assembly protein PilY1
MKIATNFVASLFALGALLGVSASRATNVAELPLKASVLAKPNVVFAMDESGSMDSELMIDGNFQGLFYGSYTSTDLYPGGQRRTGAVSGDWALWYLFPNGTGAGNRVYGDPHVNYGYGVPPTPEVAWTRSSDYNSIYYDSNRTYVPWAPGWISGASATSFPAANGAAAKSHPVNGTATMALNANLTSTSSDWKFTFLAGMTIPAGATNVQCYFATFPGALPYTVPTSRGLCKAALTYYPATFWKKEACTVDGTDCVTNYDGQRLKRYEIKAGNTFPSGRSYADELQNFANWFTYYRKRRLMLGAAMGEVLETMTGLRMGVVDFNNRVAPTMFDADATSPSANRLAVTGRFYKAEGDGGTPTHATMAYIHSQFDTNTNIIQYACQRNSSFIITDGFSNDGAVAPPAYSKATYGSGSPYETTAASSLADKALAYFTLRLRGTTSPLPTGKVPLGNQSVDNPDPNTNLHLTTYGLTLGMKGTIWPNATDPFVIPPVWPTPVSNSPTMIDDLWHATINGRGRMYLATDATATALAIRAGLQDILSQTGAQGGVAVSTVNLQRGDSRAYFGTYNPAGWVGDLTANPINQSTGEVSGTANWSAGSLLLARNWATRVIASHNGSVGVPFTEANVGSIVNPASAWGVTSEVMNYLRGDRSLEGSKFRTRTSLLGAIINSEPAVAREEGVAYVASGEGMLHAIDTRDEPGKELWAYVPRAVLPDIGQTTDRAYAFKTQLDGSPAIGKTGTSSRLLVAGMGAAGRSYYAIDVTSPRGLNESTLASKVRWEFPSVGDSTTQAKVGQTLGRPQVVRLSDGTYTVLVTSGYNNTADGKGRMWMLNASTGAIVHEFDTGTGSLGAEAGLVHVSPFGEADGSVRYVFGGDLLGNVWKFDLQTRGAPAKIAVLKDALGTSQPVTAAPELLSYAGKRIVLIGTGRLLDISDFGSSGVQSFYAIADGTTLSNARSSLVQQTYTRSTDSVTTNAVDWSATRGWFMDLPAGEQQNTRPVLSRGAIAFVTNVAGSSDCSASSYLYVLDVLSGQQYPTATFVSSQISATANSSGLNALLTAEGSLPQTCSPQPCTPPPPPPPGTCSHIVASGQTANGASWKRDITGCVTIDPSKNAWREIRR